MSDIDRKKAEVRARLEAQAAGKKAKKGFMTPERKKKLRVSSSMELLKLRYSRSGNDNNNDRFKNAAASEEKGNGGAEEGTRDESCREEEGEHLKCFEGNKSWPNGLLNFSVRVGLGCKKNFENCSTLMGQWITFHNSASKRKFV